MQRHIRAALASHVEVILGLDGLVPEIAHLAEHAAGCLASGGRIFWMGNGGSAADCQHLAAEMVGRYQLERDGLAAIALTTDTSVLTSLGNDFGFESIFARQVQALCRRGDMLIGLSTSGRSANVLAAMQRAAQIGAYRVGLTGAGGGALVEQTDLCLVVPSKNTARIQEAHILIGHLLCDLVETRLAAGAVSERTGVEAIARPGSGSG